MSDQSTEVQLALLLAGQKATDHKIAEVEAELAALRLERDKALKWGVMSLGSAVMAMGAWIFNRITTGHIQ